MCLSGYINEIENCKVRFADDELEMLLANNPKAGTFVQDNFKSIFFDNGIHGLIDSIRANIEKIEGYKKGITLFALGKI